MSHFTVIVIGENIDEQMAPYAEQDFDEKYAVFQNIEKESLTEYESDQVDIVVLPDGSAYSKYSSELNKYKNHNTPNGYPEGTIEKQGSFKEIYPTFEDFMENWHGHSEPDSKTGFYGYWSNPNAKWDWYVVGGRWTGYFKPKSSDVGTLGQPGSFNNKPRDGWVDIIKIKDIDIKAMQDSAVKEANEVYDTLDEILQGRPIPSWNTIREKHGVENIDAARAEYNSLEVVQDLNKAKFYFWGNLEETFGPNRQAYVESCKNAVMVPYAVVKDGQWYQKGEMGWFGMSSDEMSQDEWNQQFWEMINSLDPETTLTLIDCHI